MDCSTVAEGIVSTYVTGEEDPQFGGNDTYPSDAWAVWLGTSFAAPQIAGAISRTCRERTLSPRAAARRVVRGVGLSRTTAAACDCFRAPELTQSGPLDHRRGVALNGDPLRDVGLPFHLKSQPELLLVRERELEGPGLIDLDFGHHAVNGCLDQLAGMTRQQLAKRATVGELHLDRRRRAMER